MTTNRSRAATNAGQLAVRRLPALALVALVVALLAVLAPAPQADAYHYTRHNRPGSVAVPTVIGTHVYTCSYCGWSPAIQVPPFDVGRSAGSSGTQDVVVRVVVQRWDGSAWAHQTTKDRYYAIGRGAARTRIPELVLVPTRAYYLRVSVVVAWADRTTGRGLGSFAALLDQRDYACHTRFPCEAGNGYVWLRSP